VVSYAQDCNALTPNEAGIVQYRMLRANSLDDGRRAALEDGIAALGGAVRWRVSPRVDRTYALVELPDGATTNELPLDAAVAEGAPVIALAVSPTVAEALPLLVEVLGGPGRPSGVLACESAGGAAVIEWDLDRTSATVILDLIDTELARFHSGRTTELLTPLSETWQARIAADGLQCPEIAPDRILETLVAQARLDV
jgi:hypothetical protein